MRKYCGMGGWALALFYSFHLAYSQPIASITPVATGPFTPNQPFWVEIQIGDPVPVSGLYGISFKLKSKNASLSYLEGSASAGPFLGASPLVFFQKVDAQTVDMAISKTSAPGVSGSGVIAKAQFMAPIPGTDTVMITEILAVDKDGGAIPLAASILVVTVECEPRYWKITAASGAHGSISPSGVISVENGENQTFTMKPDTTYHVSDVAVDGISVGAVCSYTFSNVVSDHTISASFMIDTYTITASAGKNGSVTPSGVISVECGANQAFTITPNDRYRVDSVLVDMINVDSSTSYTFCNVRSSHTLHVLFTPVTSANDCMAGFPASYQLFQNFPNPFNPSTTISFVLPQPSCVTLTVIDVLGRDVAVIINGMKASGTYKVTWSAENFPSGIYFYRLQAGAFTQTKRLLLLK